MKKAIIIPILAFLVLTTFAQEKTEVLPLDKNLNQYYNIRDFCLAENGNEAYFTIQSPFQEISQIARITRKKDDWSEPQLMPFCDSFMYLEPALSDNGLRLYFVSNRLLNNASSEKKDFDIWYVERKNIDSNWSDPINLGSPINTEGNEFYPSLSKNNNLYFTLEAPQGMGKDDIYVAIWNGLKYETPVLLNQNVNSEGYEFNAFISNNEDYLIFTKYNTEDGYGSGDLYISKKDAAGEWQKATNLGLPINSKFMEYCPFYDEKNQTLYFTSKRNNITPRSFSSLAEFQDYIINGENGLSKIYRTIIKIE